MDKEKALEILSNYMKCSDESEPVDFDNAILQGIEALKKQSLKETECEEKRVLGIKQAAACIRNMHDQPTLADEIIKYVIPHGYKVKRAIIKEILAENITRQALSQEGKEGG